MYLEKNSKIKDKNVFQENSYPEIRKTYNLAPKWGVNLYMDNYGNWVGCRLVFGRHFSNSTMPIYLVFCKDLGSLLFRIEALIDN